MSSGLKEHIGVSSNLEKQQVEGKLLVSEQTAAGDRTCGIKGEREIVEPQKENSGFHSEIQRQ